ncbi:MAG: CRISPR-associated protein Cas4 [Candidatus Aenigmarchaeota archaeon]|nr:CRISPR-associated protein Cas4 [Candidatus Aenigmarchaeota archaeon]
MISVTDLTAFHFCPRKLFLSKVAKLHEPLKDVIVLGSIKHKIIETMPELDKEMSCNLTKELDSEKFVQEYVRQSTTALRMIIVQQKDALRSVSVPLDSAFEKTKQLAVSEAEKRAKYLHDFAHKHQLFGVNLWENLTPKEKPEYSLSSSKLQLKGRIDALKISPDKIIPVEHKSGQPPEEGAWESHKLQLSAYALLLENLFETSITHGIINYFDAGLQREIQINPFAKDEVKQMIPVVTAVLSQKEIPPTINNINKCKSCGYYSYCEKEIKIPIAASGGVL